MPDPAAKLDKPAELTFKPVTRATRADFETVFRGPGGPKYCWCMVWRATKEEGRGTPSDVRERQMLSRIDGGVPVGLVGYDGGEPVAWVSIAPKETYQRLGGPEPAPGETVWSLACMYLRRRLRHQGRAHELIDAAVKYAARRGATVVEAYPVADNAPSYRFMGFISAYKRAGFGEVGREGSRRHVMHLTLKDRSQSKS